MNRAIPKNCVAGGLIAVLRRGPQPSARAGWLDNANPAARCLTSRSPQEFRSHSGDDSEENPNCALFCMPPWRAPPPRRWMRRRISSYRARLETVNSILAPPCDRIHRRRQVADSASQGQE